MLRNLLIILMSFLCLFWTWFHLLIVLYVFRQKKRPVKVSDPSRTYYVYSAILPPLRPHVLSMISIICETSCGFFFAYPSPKWESMLRIDSCRYWSVMKLTISNFSVIFMFVFVYYLYILAQKKEMSMTSLWKNM